MRAGLFLMALGAVLVLLWYNQITPHEFEFFIVWPGIICFLAGIVALVIGQFGGRRAA